MRNRSLTTSPMVTSFGDWDDVFGGMMNNFGLTPWRGDGLDNVFPMHLDFSETEKGYSLTADLPGIDKKDIDISWEDGMLTIKGERRTEEETKEKNFHRMERSYGSFCRRLSMPSDADESNVEADMKNGVLTIMIGKTKETPPKARKVTIR